MDVTGPTQRSVETNNVNGDEHPREKTVRELLADDLSLEHGGFPQEQTAVVVPGLVLVPATDERVQPDDASMEKGNGDEPAKTQRQHGNHIVDIHEIGSGAEEEDEGDEETEEKRQTTELELDEVLRDVLGVGNGLDEPNDRNAHGDDKNEGKGRANRQPAV